MKFATTRVITRESPHKHRYNLITQGFVLRIRIQPRNGVSRGGGAEGRDEPSGNAENIFADFPAFQKRCHARVRAHAT